MTVDSGIPKKGLSLLLDIAAKHGFKEDAVVDYHIGILGGRASGNLFAVSGGGVAGIYNVATLPEVRQQGIERAR